MATTTPVSQLIINKLTKEQYNALEYKDPYQLYMVTDGTSTALTLGSWVSTTRTDIPYGLLRADGKCYSSELSSGDVPIYYTKDYFPSLWSALENGTIRSVGTYTFEKILETNGWCGVFGFGKEEVTRKFYSWGGLYWLLSETPKTGDRAYDANGEETDRTVTVAEDGSVTFVQDVSGGTVSGLVRDSANDYSITQTLGRDDVFYMPKVTNHEQQNITPKIDGSNKNLGRILVAEQIPTAENLYRWYKLYSDGWVEQGGYFDVAATSGTVTLQIQMANSHYVVTTSEYESATTDTGGIDLAVMLGQYTTTSFYFSQASTARNANWVLYGYANTTKIPGFRIPEDNFLIQAYNSNKEVTISDYITILQEYKEETIKPDIYNYSEGLKPELQEYVDEAQAWATSDTIVDEAKNVYSAKWYAEQSEKNSTGFPILYPHWSDRILNDARWLGADDFSWHSGDVYVAAYEHLAGEVKSTQKKYYAWSGMEIMLTFYTEREVPVAGDIVYTTGITEDEWTEYGELVSDYDGSGYLYVSSQRLDVMRSESKDIVRAPGFLSDTIGDITITYYLAEDGHKICLPDQEANLISLYETERVAWYFILDTENKQFKLPRELPLYAGHAPIYGNTARQGDGNGAKGAPLLASTDNVSGSKGITTGGSSGTAGAEFYVGFQQIANAYADVSALRAANDGSQKYLYFYVGNHLENLDTINVGHLTEVINDFDPETFRDEVNEIKTVATQEINETTQESISTLKNMGEVVNYTNITNCITEIPQDIKVELVKETLYAWENSVDSSELYTKTETPQIGDYCYGSTGAVVGEIVDVVSYSSGIRFVYDDKEWERYTTADTTLNKLVLKAGSKIYVPNGPGVFNAVTSTADVSTTRTDSQECIVWRTASGGLNIFPKILFYSGTTAPTQYQYMFWYDTTENKCKVTSDSGSTWAAGASFPICLVETDGTKISAIKQVFNGFGHVGATVFALPGVKGLIPNGRNADGSLKSNTLNITSVKTYTIHNTAIKEIRVASSGLWGYVGYIVSDTAPSGNFNMWYNPVENIMYDTGAGTLSTLNATVGISVEYNGTRITSFTPKTAFHAVDYNDAEFISHQAMPSDRYIDLTPLGASDARYTAPADGYVVLKGNTTVADKAYGITNESNGMRTLIRVPTSGSDFGVCMPVSSQQQYSVKYEGALASGYTFRFVYANGGK